MQYQLILFGRVTLQREYAESETSVQSGLTRFHDIFIRENIIINDQTAGQAVNIIINEDEIILYLCFEPDDRYQLRFSSRRAELDSFFHLDYRSSNGRVAAAIDERGFLEYGGHTYRLRYSGERSPYLMIRLFQTDLDMPITRTAEGRRIH